MTSRTLSVIGLVVVVLAAVFFLARGEPETGRKVDVAAGAGRATKAGPVGSGVVLSMAPGTAASPAATARSNVSPLMAEYTSSRGYKAIYERLKALPSPGPEELAVMARILDSCANVTDRKKFPGKPWTLGGEEARARFVASLSPKVPNRDQRLAAFDAINYDSCQGLRDLQTTEAEIRALLERAAAAGDPKARIELMRLQLADQRRDSKGEFDYTKTLSISDSQLAAWREVVNSGDPRAVVDAVQLLANSGTAVHLRGPDEAPLDMFALIMASRLVACDLGRQCGRESDQLRQGCAFEGNCDAADLRDYMLFYQTSPGRSQNVILYQAQLLNAIRNNDWSFFTFQRGPAPPFAAYNR